MPVLSGPVPSDLFDDIDNATLDGKSAATAISISSERIEDNVDDSHSGSDSFEDEAFVSSVDSSNFVLGRFVTRPDGTVFDQASRLPVRLIHHITGKKTTYHPRKPITDWNDRRQIRYLNKWHRQIWRRCRGLVRRTEERLAWSEEEMDWVYRYYIDHPTVATTDILEPFNLHFTGKVVSLVNGRPQVCKERSQTGLNCAIRAFGLDLYAVK